MEFVTTFELLKGVSAPTETKEYTLRFSKNASGSAFYNWSKPPSMGLLLRAPSFNTSNYCIEGAPTREETINGQTRTAFVVPDPSEIPFAATITNTGTFFGSPVYTLIFNSTLSGYNLTSLAMGEQPFSTEANPRQSRGLLTSPKQRTEKLTPQHYST